MLSFWVEANLCRFFIVYLYMYCCWKSSYQQGRAGILLICLTPPHFCGCPEPGPGPWISNIICRAFVCSVGLFGVVSDCLFCWYWLNWWPSLFKLSFHNLFVYPGVTSVDVRSWTCRQKYTYTIQPIVIKTLIGINVIIKTYLFFFIPGWKSVILLTAQGQWNSEPLILLPWVLLLHLNLAVRIW